jgi:hypothetical protein
MLAIKTKHLLSFFSVLALSMFATHASGQTGKNHGAVPITDGEQGEARQRYSRGLQFVKEGNYQAALIEMQRAYALSPSYKIQYNLGQIHGHLGDAAAAVTSYERYLSEGGADVPTPRAAEVAQEINRLRVRVGTVDLSVKGDGAEVLLDDIVIGRSPFKKKIFVNIGKHRFAASRLGSEQVTRIVAVAGEDSIAVELDIAPAFSGAASSTVQPGPTPRPSALSSETPSSPIVVPSSKATAHDVDIEAKSQPSSERRYVWIGWTLTGACAAGTIVAGLVARKEANDLSNLRNSPKATRHDLDNAASSAFRAALVTDILMGATLVSAGVSLYYNLTVTKPAGKAKVAESPNVRVAVGPNALHVLGTF